MVELISKVSKGSRMDQIYIPKNRSEFPIGSYVIVNQIETKKEEVKPFFYNVKYLEPIKIEIIKKIIKTIDQNITSENIIMMGSFLNKGFRFNDIDIIVITGKTADVSHLEELLENIIGIKSHLTMITNKALVKGLSTDPLFRAALGRFVSKKRAIYRMDEMDINYKILDLHFLKSNLMADNFDLLTGDEKYKLARNLAAIYLSINKNDVKNIDLKVSKLFNVKIIDLKNNMAQKKEFLEKYKKIYNNTKNKIFEGMKNGSKQKQAD